MARPQKRGWDYFPLDVGFFEDRDIKALKGRYGPDGIIVYIYLLCLIYKENGYYIKANDDFLDELSDDLNMNYEKIGQIINFLCKRSLFDSTLFTSDKVLTSHGIQLRFQEMAKARAAKREIKIDKYWVLDTEETQHYIKVVDFQSYSENNSSYSEKNDSYSMKKPYKVKQRKVKESKAKQSKVTALPDAAADAQKNVPKDIIELYQENVSRSFINAVELQSIGEWLDKVDADVVRWAVNEAAKHNAHSWAYIEKILQNHYNSGHTTLEAVKAAGKGFTKDSHKNTKIYQPGNYDSDSIDALMRAKYG